MGNAEYMGTLVWQLGYLQSYKAGALHWNNWIG